MDTIGIRGAMQAASDRWNAAFNDGDAAAVAALYTSDGTVLPHTHAIVRGSEGIRDFWSGVIAAGFKEHGIELFDVEASGDLAYAAGKWWATGPDPAEGRKRYEGSIVTVFRREGGGWKACLHIWN